MSEETVYRQDRMISVTRKTDEVEVVPLKRLARELSPVIYSECRKTEGGPYCNPFLGNHININTTPNDTGTNKRLKDMLTHSPLQDPCFQASFRLSPFP